MATRADVQNAAELAEIEALDKMRTALLDLEHEYWRTDNAPAQAAILAALEWVEELSQ